MVESSAWLGDPPTRDALARVPEIEEAHVIAGPATLLLKIRAATTEELQGVLRQILGIEGVTGTRTIVVLETAFDRPLDVAAASANRTDRTRRPSGPVARGRARSGSPAS